MNAPILIVPSMVAESAVALLKTMTPEWLERTLVVDNGDNKLHRNPELPAVAHVIRPGKNVGVSRSWNHGVHYAEAAGASHLVLMSENIRFKSMDFLEALDWERPTPLSSVYSWHLVAIPTTYFRIVGNFDEDFYPAYFEDTDWQYRAKQHGMWGDWEKDEGTRGTVEDLGFATTLNSGAIHIEFGPLLDLYIAKHGGKPGQEIR